MIEITALREATAGAGDTRLTERGEMSLCQLYTEPNRIAASPNISKVSKNYRPRPSIPVRSMKEEAHITERKRLKPLSRTMVVSSSLIDDDGFSWSKYGQKEIMGTNNPRAYFRCTHHRTAQGCPATKQVQRRDDDPNMYDVTYVGEHSCRKGLTDQSSLSVSGGVSATASTSSQVSEISSGDNQANEPSMFFPEGVFKSMQSTPGE